MAILTVTIIVTETTIKIIFLNGLKIQNNCKECLSHIIQRLNELHCA